SQSTRRGKQKVATRTLKNVRQIHHGRTTPSFRLCCYSSLRRHKGPAKVSAAFDQPVSGLCRTALKYASTETYSQKKKGGSPNESRLVFVVIAFTNTGETS
ncbi:MAG: hypothetical protein KDA69_03840, partial [Planctomycetaceae bacterium]|nr:hypothetical protein [Planctomycetaceae bacterium]